MRPGTRLRCNSPPNAEFCLPHHLAPRSPAPQQRRRWAPLGASCPWAGAGVSCSALGRQTLSQDRSCGSEPLLLSKKGFCTVTCSSVKRHSIPAQPSWGRFTDAVPLPRGRTGGAEGRGSCPPWSQASLGCRLCGAAGRASEKGSLEAGGDRRGPNKERLRVQTRGGPSNRLFCLASAAQKQPPCAHCPRAGP